VSSALEVIAASWNGGTWLPRALLASVAGAVAAAMLGVLLYWRRMSLLPDALTHAALPGVAAGYVVAGGPHPVAILGGAAAGGLGASLGADVLRERLGMRADAAVGVMYALLFALGVVLVSTVGRRAHIDLDCVLFGSLLGVSDATLALLVLSWVAVVAAAATLPRVLAHATADRLHARAVGLPVRAIERGTLVLTATVAVLALDAGGIVFALAAFALPAAAAHRIARSFAGMLAVAGAVGGAGAAGGVLASVVLDVAPGGAVATTLTGLYGLSLLPRWRRRG
jgi:ABC-type Mn2+/Zn2+ transport system permease subunit